MGTEVTSASEESGNISVLEQKIIRQVEYYFGNYNLSKDKFLKEQLKLNDGWVPLETLVKFNRLKSLTEDFDTICKALTKSPNELVEISEDSTKIRRSVEKPLPEGSYINQEDVEDRTLYVKGFKRHSTLDELLEFFKNYKVEHVFMRKRFQGNKKVFKGSCFVSFDTQEDAQKFLDNKSIKFEGTELLKEKKKDYTKRKDIYYDNLRAEKEKKLLKKTSEKKDEDEDNVEDVKVPDDFLAGCLLKVCGLDEHMTREVLKKELGEYGDISYVDYSRGKPEGIVRFEKPGIAAQIFEKAAEEDGVKKFTFDSCKATISLIEGDSEQEYWKSIAKSKVDMKQKKFTDGRKGRFKKNFFGKRPRGNAREDGNTNEPSRKKFKNESTEEKADQESNGQEKEMSETTS
ncbi:lupus La protein [Trichonephila inaurata madagascariensis]|uniref:Lupus La protein n=1 Tax=Trichonephila inaurata madagascariensis TaxID=2747483 RepID=A0A8X7BU17_9ARAC|nr:lupus La protein [Trichonephila inaurata madagascariensis]